MSNSLFLAIGFFTGTLVGVAVMALAAAGELRRRPAPVHVNQEEGRRA